MAKYYTVLSLYKAFCIDWKILSQINIWKLTSMYLPQKALTDCELENKFQI